MDSIWNMLGPVIGATLGGLASSSMFGADLFSGLFGVALGGIAGMAIQQFIAPTTTATLVPTPPATGARRPSRRVGMAGEEPAIEHAPPADAYALAAQQEKLAEEARAREAENKRILAARREAEEAERGIAATAAARSAAGTPAEVKPSAAAPVPAVKKKKEAAGVPPADLPASVDVPLRVIRQAPEDPGALPRFHAETTSLVVVRGKGNELFVIESAPSDERYFSGGHRDSGYRWESARPAVDNAGDRVKFFAGPGGPALYKGRNPGGWVKMHRLSGAMASQVEGWMARNGQPIEQMLEAGDRGKIMDRGDDFYESSGPTGKIPMSQFKALHGKARAAREAYDESLRLTIPVTPPGLQAGLTDGNAWPGEDTPIPGSLPIRTESERAPAPGRPA